MDYLSNDKSILNDFISSNPNLFLNASKISFKRIWWLIFLYPALIKQVLLLENCHREPSIAFFIWQNVWYGSTHIFKIVLYILTPRTVQMKQITTDAGNEQNVQAQVTITSNRKF